MAANIENIEIIFPAQFFELCGPPTYVMVWVPDYGIYKLKWWGVDHPTAAHNGLDRWVP